MATERFQQLIKDLRSSTLAGRIRWQETADEYSFRVGLGDGMVRISPGQDSNDRSYTAYLIDHHGRVVDTYRVSEDMLDFHMIEDLYDNARATALNVDQVIESMLSDLNAGKTRELPSETETEDMPF